MRIYAAMLVGGVSGSASAAPKLDPDAALRAAEYGVAGTVLIVESAKYPCWNALRALVHVEAALRPGSSHDDAGELLWLEARTPRAGADAACELAFPYTGDPALIRPGARVAAFVERAEVRDLEVDARSWAAPIVYAAPFHELPAVAH